MGTPETNDSTTARPEHANAEDENDLKNKFMKSSQREGQGGKKGGETVTRK